MTRYLYFTATTLDGFIADEQDSLDWLFEQERKADEPYDRAAGAGAYDTFRAGIGAAVMGATTYEWILAEAAEEARRGEGDGAWPYTLPVLVFSHRDLRPAAETVRVVSGAPADHRAALEEAAGDLDVWVVGGGALAADFAEAGMLDQVLLSIAPVTLGAGRPLFPRRFDLRLREHDRNGAFLVAVYDVVGPRTRSAEPGEQPPG